MSKLKNVINDRYANLSSMLICLTILFIVAQIALFGIHYKVSELVDSMVNNSFLLQLFQTVILLPLFFFLFIQTIAYALWVMWIWFLAVSLGDLFKLSNSTTYWLGILIWLIACLALLTLNKYYYPNSFFAEGISHLKLFRNGNELILILSLACLLLATCFSYVNFFWFKRCRYSGVILLLIFLSMVLTAFYNKREVAIQTLASQSKPNIIFIGLDSLRPDFTGYYGNKEIKTPHIDAFLKTSTNFTNAYTPLARTFPSWMSILTAKYPKHNDARNNLINQRNVITHDTVAKYLRAEGYETIYATDEKRFSNITEEYGFDQILGPQMGINDFILGGLSDFPLTNLLINLPIGRFLFPYNYANRAAAITYQPDKFLQIIKTGLEKRSTKPLFLAVHFCLTHWPYTWARDGLNEHLSLPRHYMNSVQGVDKQFGELMEILKKQGLLNNSVVVVLSDHGTAMGLPNEVLISESKFQGNQQDLNLIPKFKLVSAPEFSVSKKDYTISTAYGQGNNVLSFTQYHVVLAFKRFGDKWPPSQINEVSSLMDVSPTVLDILNLKPLQHTDGISLRNFMFKRNIKPTKPRNFYIETGDSFSEIETDHIYIENVIKGRIGIYSINSANGLLSMTPTAAQGLIKAKQLAIIQGDWLLAHYPENLQAKLVRDEKNPTHMKLKTITLPAYFVLVNLKTKEWTIGLNSAFAKKAPISELLGQLKDFYGNELPDIARN